MHVQKRKERERERDVEVILFTLPLKHSAHVGGLEWSNYKGLYSHPLHCQDDCHDSIGSQHTRGLRDEDRQGILSRWHALGPELLD